MLIGAASGSMVRLPSMANTGTCMSPDGLASVLSRRPTAARSTTSLLLAYVLMLMIYTDRSSQYLEKTKMLASP